MAPVDDRRVAQQQGIDNAALDIELEAAASSLDRSRSGGIQDLTSLDDVHFRKSLSIDYSMSSNTDDEDHHQQQERRNDTVISDQQTTPDTNNVVAKVGKLLEAFWSSVGNVFTEQRLVVKSIIYVVIALLYNAYLVASIYYAVHNGHPIDYCDGVGFLIVSTAVVYLGLFYFQIVKRFWAKAIYRVVFKPLGAAIDRVWKYR